MRIILISIFCIFLGRAYQYLFWDAPLRALIWDERLMKTPIKWLTGQDWQEFASNPSTNEIIRNYSLTVSLILVLATICAFLLYFSKNSNWLHVPIWISSILLLFHTVLMMKEKFYHIAQLFEGTIQIAIPIVFLFWIKGKFKTEGKILFTLKLLIAITFIAHGLYAIGFYPVPGQFVDMTIRSLGISETMAKSFLLFAGIMDIIIAIGIWLPKIDKFVLIYAMVWGFLTAFARVWAGINIDFFWSTLHESAYQTIYRLPHGFIPLAVLYFLYRANRPFLFLQKNDAREDH